MTDKKGLTTFQLKVFACLVMVIDHVSAIFMPFYDPLDSSTWPWAFALTMISCAASAVWRCPSSRS